MYAKIDHNIVFQEKISPISFIENWHKSPKAVIINDIDRSCNTPPELKGQYLQDVDLLDLSCRFPSPELPDACPEPCECRYVPQSFVSLNCSGKGLASYPAFIPLVLDAAKVALDLSRNNLTTAAPGAVSGNFSRIFELDLSHNQVIFLEQPMSGSSIDFKILTLWVLNLQLLKSAFSSF
jgi:hypothetical protein